ncbi:hypothetical protein RAE21_19030 [Rhodoferax sp. TBRC 17198]|uniref:hypothetical protein n=1 Tax=Rhodoferax potami TaxID=3068338 RepID=UPI0028BE0045|nr:hypothetical protein [Rhodoferax sp. TBRC 17198]MDT7524444.1 hypothetical protein [Rhodoferax sp. TBRC 17198]
MSPDAPHHIHGIDTNRLSERARQLLLKVTFPAERGADTPSLGHSYVLAWTLLSIPATRLERFADYVGVLGAAATLRKVLDGRRMAIFREKLGQELYLFGMLRAPLVGMLAVPPYWFEDPEQAGTAVREAGMAALHAYCHGLECDHPMLAARVSARLNAVDRDASTPRLLVMAPSGALLQRVLREAEPILAGALDAPGEAA